MDAVELFVECFSLDSFLFLLTGHVLRANFTTYVDVEKHIMLVKQFFFGKTIFMAKRQEINNGADKEGH